MNIEFTIYEKTLLVKLSGELDHHSAQRVRESCDEKIETLHMRNVIFDFKEVAFMDSSGIGAIMGRYNKIKEMSGKAAVINCNGYADRILKLSGIYTIISRYDNLKEALEKLNGKDER